MSTELWKNRIVTSTDKSRHFTFFNPTTNGLGSWIEFTELIQSESGGRTLQMLKFKIENGEGFLNVADHDGKVRDPFFDRGWFYGELTRQGYSIMVRFRFLDEASSGPELGTRVFTHWRHGQWKELPKQDFHGKLLDADNRISFGWSVNGNAYYSEAKPAEADAPKETTKVPKSFAPKPSATASPVEPKAEEVKIDATPVKKPKMFVPKSKLPDAPQT
jgi:hypothetical protein